MAVEASENKRRLDLKLFFRVDTGSLVKFFFTLDALWICSYGLGWTCTKLNMPWAFVLRT